MPKNLDISLLFDFYGELLTEKQREVIELYYNADLSLAEISQISGITRQGVRDSIKRAETQLVECEEKLGLYGRFHQIENGLKAVVEKAKLLKKENERLAYSKEYAKYCDEIIGIAEELNA